MQYAILTTIFSTRNNHYQWSSLTSIYCVNLEICPSRPSRDDIRLQTHLFHDPLRHQYENPCDLVGQSYEPWWRHLAGNGLSYRTQWVSLSKLWSILVMSNSSVLRAPDLTLRRSGVPTLSWANRTTKVNAFILFFFPMQTVLKTQ